MTNVPFINKITNELSKRKLKSDVVANAILDIAVGNDRLDNLLTMHSSASEIDNTILMVGNVKNYGAVGDGITSDSQAIQDAINTTDIIILPSGHTFLMKNVRIPSGKTIIMTGAILKFGGTNPTETRIENQSGLFYAYGTSTEYVSNIHLIGGLFVGNRQPTNWAVQIGVEYGIDLIQMSFCKNVSIKNGTFSEAGQDGIEFKECESVEVSNNYFFNIADACVEVRGKGKVVIENNYFYMSRNALFVKNHEEFAKSRPTNIYFLNNVCKTYHSPVIFHQSKNVQITGNIMLPVSTPDLSIKGVDVTAINSASPPTEAENNDIEDTIISGNTIIGFKKGIALVQQFSGNIYNTQVYNNTVLNCGAGISVYGSGRVYNNKFETITETDPNSFCIDLTGNESSYLEVIGNTLLAVAKAISVNSSGRVFISSNKSNSSDTFGTVFSQPNYLVFDKNHITSSTKGINLYSYSGIKVYGNYIKSTDSGVIADGGLCDIENNEIIILGTSLSYGVKVKGTDTACVSNRITTASNYPAIEYLSVSSGGRVESNIISQSAGASAIRVYASNVIISKNITRGGNQGIRCYAANNIVTGNNIQNALFQGLKLESTCINSICTDNISINNTTNLENAGTGNIIANNITT